MSTPGAGQPIPPDDNARLSDSIEVSWLKDPKDEVPKIDETEKTKPPAVKIETNRPSKSRRKTGPSIMPSSEDFKTDRDFEIIDGRGYKIRDISSVKENIDLYAPSNAAITLAHKLLYEVHGKNSNENMKSHVLDFSGYLARLPENYDKKKFEKDDHEAESRFLNKLQKFTVREIKTLFTFFNVRTEGMTKKADLISVMLGFLRAPNPNLVKNPKSTPKEKASIAAAAVPAVAGDAVSQTTGTKGTPGRPNKGETKTDKDDDREGNSDSRGQPTPPDDNALLADLIEDSWLKDPKTKVKKIYVISLKEEASVFQAVQSLLTLDLKIFLHSGEKKKMDEGLGRMVELDFKMDEGLYSDADVELLSKKIQDVQKWHTDDGERKKYLAPVLPIIQSSGTGKTRLLKEIREKDDLTRLILLTDVKQPFLSSRSADQTFDRVYQLTPTYVGRSFENEQNNLREMVFGECLSAKEVYEAALSKRDETLPDRIPVVLMFDEAQHLFKASPDTDPSALFRSLRWISREIPKLRTTPNRPFDITLVFAGTDLTLGNPFPEKTVTSRSSRYLKMKVHVDSGSELYGPFYSLRTTSALVSLAGDHLSRPTEYERAIPYGRPLFELMHRENQLDNNLLNVLNKMLLDRASDFVNGDSLEQRSACMSILGTRVQLGRTSVAVASDLVSKGYAHLTYYRPPDEATGIPAVAGFKFLPEPVCARLAMCMMDEDWTLSDYGPRQARGRAKTYWTKKLSAAYSDALFTVNKRYFDKQSVALYLLFCGDVLRKLHDDDYRTFSVGLLDWLRVLAGMGHIGGEAQTDQNQSIHIQALPSATVNCIQFHQASLRFSLGDFAEPDFLKELYEMANGMYAHNDCESIDLLVPIKDGVDFHPLFVSIKNHQHHLEPVEAKDFARTSVAALAEAGVTKGLFLLVVVGSDGSTSAHENALGEERTTNVDAFEFSDDVAGLVSGNIEDVGTKIVPKILLVGEDKFGITSNMVRSRQSQDAFTDVLGGHHLLLRRDCDSKMRDELLHNEAGDEEKEYFSNTYNFRGEPLKKHY